MTPKIKRIPLIALALALLVMLAFSLVGRDAPADAQSISCTQGRYQFIDLGNENEVPGDHFAIFDTESGVLREWVGKKGGEMWTYSAAEGREIVRRSITVR